ncbi:putative uncharacterized protein DDB_G0277255 [Uranotaenia lowii]|uniref:putative uncharacterized protein DDB_G0277255 n=1 Tax=Uranotaenia lowii TaxID=190385 RepID=UPI002479427F|nr:putative uncharacterized protein DDB_G0277255 [Uranotaenia lowii]
MTGRMRLLTTILLVCLQLGEILSKDGSDRPLDSEDIDREMGKNNEDGYDFLSIDQLFQNNPEYAKLLSDLQAHSFGSNWRRKRSVEIVEEQTSPNEISPETTDQEEDTAATVPIAEVTEVIKETRETKEASESRTGASKSTAPLPSSTTDSASFGSSGSTEASSRQEELTTPSPPIRSSTPRRLRPTATKTSNKNKNKQGNQNKIALNKIQLQQQLLQQQQQQQQHQQDLANSVTAQNVNKFTVSNTPSPTVASTPLSTTVSTMSAANFNSNAATSSGNMAVAAAAVANVTGNNKDKFMSEHTLEDILVTVVYNQ